MREWGGGRERAKVLLLYVCNWRGRRGDFFISDERDWSAPVKERDNIFSALGLRASRIPHTVSELPAVHRKVTNVHHNQHSESALAAAGA